jgi:hypothetical protein
MDYALLGISHGMAAVHGQEHGLLPWVLVTIALAIYGVVLPVAVLAAV